MAVALAFVAPKKIEFVEEADPPVGPGEVRLRTLFSGISAGTALTVYRGSNPYLSKTWDAERRLFTAGAGEVRGYPKVEGYQEVGEIVEVGAGVNDLVVGQKVFGIWGHREGKVVTAEYARPRLLPAHVPPMHGIFSRMGDIALNAILDGQINLGETVAIFGLGIIGQLTVQLARLSGATVIAVDLVPRRRELAQKLGADVVLDGRAGAAEEIKRLTGNRGADLCIEASGANRALHEAIRACAYSSRVVATGFYQGEGTGLLLGDEFHHNRIEIVCSQISGVNTALRHRWSRERLTEVFMKLVADGRVQVEPLVSHVVPFREAAPLFDIIDTRTDEVMQGVLAFGGAA